MNESPIPQPTIIPDGGQTLRWTDPVPPPTVQAHIELQLAYNFFNTHLFKGSLPPAMIILQRTSRAYGHFHQEKWENRKNEVRDEIALNPTHLRDRTIEQTLSTLAHEMTHLWQAHYGTRTSLRKYHDKEWAHEMERIGLCPSSTGLPGGKKTGTSISHYVMEKGPFALACTQLFELGFTFSWLEHFKETSQEKKGSRTKYTCPTCMLRAWAKKDANLTCGDCREPLEVG
jgi:predicted SprT family Zn-dependent metalloprotease